MLLFFKEMQPLYSEFFFDLLGVKFGNNSFSKYTAKMVEGKLVDRLYEGFPEYSELRSILFEAKKDGHTLAVSIQFSKQLNLYFDDFLFTDF